MAQVTIEDPIINSPFVEPARHFVMDADGKVTGEIAPRRRPSEFFVPVARPRKLSAQMSMDQFGGPTRQQPNEIVNEIRQAVARWRQQDTRTSPRSRATSSSTGATTSVSAVSSSARSKPRRRPST